MITITRTQYRINDGTKQMLNYTNEQIMQDMVDYMKREQRHATVEEKVDGKWTKLYSF